MIRIISIPQSDNVKFSIPKEYIGKEVEIIVFPKEEVSNSTTPPTLTTTEPNHLPVTELTIRDHQIDRTLTIVNPYI
jgi:hypothetical protein